MADVIKTIGTTGRDYSTVTAWEADLDDTGIYSSGDNAIGELYNDSAFDENAIVNSGLTVGLNTIKVTAAESDRHDGTAGSGVRWVRTSASTCLDFDYSISDSIGCIIEWIEFDHNGSNPVDQIVDMFNGTIESRISHNIIHSNNINAGTHVGLRHALNGNISITNNIVYDIGRTSGAGSARVNGIYFSLNDATNEDYWIYNNTVHSIFSTGTGDAIGCYIEPTSGTNFVHIRNNVATDSSIDGTGAAEDFHFVSTYSDNDYNASADTTAIGSNSLNNIVSSDNFVSTVVGSEDLHLKSGADCIDAGDDLGVSPTDVELDIDARDRDANGDVWDIGADEFVSEDVGFENQSRTGRRTGIGGGFGPRR